MADKDVSLGIVFTGKHKVLIDSIDAVTAALKKLDAAVDNGAKSFTPLQQAVKNVTTAQKQAKAETDKQTESTKKAKAETDRFVKAQKAATATSLKYASALKTVGVTLTALSTAFGAGLSPASAFNTALKNIYTGAKILDPSLRASTGAIKQQATSLNTLSTAFGAAFSPTVKLTTALKNFFTNAKILDPALRNISSTMQKQIPTVDSVARGFGVLGIKLENTKPSAARTAVALKNLFTNVKILDPALRALSNTMQRQVGTTSSLAKGFSYLGIKLQNTTTATYKHAAAQTKTTATLQKQSGVLARLGSSFKTLASYMVAGRAIMMFTNALTGGIKEIANFDQALHNLKAITNATDLEILGMKTSLIDLAQNTKFSTGELAKGMVLLGQSGFEAKEAISAIDAVATLASATLSGLAVTSQLLTTTVRAYGLEAVEAGRVSDVMANAVNKSKLTIDKLNTAFNYVGVTAAQAGLSVEETAATMMVLANNGLRASTIGTGFRQVLSRLIAPNRKLRDAFKEQNIELSAVNPTIVGYENALEELSAVLYNTETRTVDMGKAFSLFGLRGAQASAVIVKSFMDGKFDEALDKAGEVGTALKMMEEQMKGLAFKFKNLQDVIKTFAVSLGDAGLLGAFKAIVDTMKEGFLVTIRFMQTDIGNLVAKFILLTTALSGTYLALAAFSKLSMLAPLVGIGQAALAVSLKLGILKGAMVALKLTVWNLQKAMLTLWPLTLIAAITATVLSLKHMVTANERLIESNQKALSTIQANIQSYGTYIGILKKLQEEKRRGVDVSKQEKTVLAQLLKLHPELKDEIDLSTASIGDLVEAMERLHKQEHKKEIANLSSTYKAQLVVIQKVKDSWDLYSLSQKDVTQRTKDLIEPNKKLNGTFNLMALQLTQQAREMGLSGTAMADYAYQMAIATGNSEQFAEKIKNKIIANLQEEAKELKKTTKERANYTQIIIDDAAKSVESIQTISDAEEELLTVFKNGMKDRAKALKAHEIDAEDFRRKNLVAEIKLASDIVAIRKKELDDVSKLLGEKHNKTLAAQKDYDAAEKQLRDIKKKEIKKDLETELLELDAQLKAKNISETQHYVQSLELKRKHTKIEIEDNAEALATMLAQKGAAGVKENADYQKLLKRKAELADQYAEIMSVYAKEHQERDLEALRVAAEKELDVHLFKYAEMIRAGKSNAAELEAQNKQVQLSQDIYNSLLVDMNKESYEVDLVNLKEALALKDENYAEINDKILALEKKHWQSVLDEANAGLEKLRIAEVTSGDHFDELMKRKKQALKEMTAADKEYAKNVKDSHKVISDSWDKVINEGVSAYKLTLAELDSQYDEQGKKSKQYIKQALELYTTYVEDLLRIQKAKVAAMVAAEAPLVEVNKAKLRVVELEKLLKDAIAGTSKELGIQNGKLDENKKKTGQAGVEWDKWARKIGLTSGQLKGILSPLGAAGKAGVKAASMSYQEWKKFAAQVGMTVTEVKKAVAAIMKEIEKATEAAKKLKTWQDVSVYSPHPSTRIEGLKGLSTDALTKKSQYYSSVTSGGLTMSDAEAKVLSRAIIEWIAAEKKARAAEDAAAKASLRATQTGNEIDAKIAEDLAKTADALRTYADHLAKGYASGGVVEGVGTGDTVPIMATPGEIVIPVPVINSGKISEFLAGLGQNLKIPKVSFPVQKMATGGIVQKATDMINLNFQFGSKQYPVTAEAGIGKALAVELKRMSLVAR